MRNSLPTLLRLLNDAANQNELVTVVRQRCSAAIDKLCDALNNPPDEVSVNTQRADLVRQAQLRKAECDNKDCELAALRA